MWEQFSNTRDGKLPPALPRCAACKCLQGLGIAADAGRTKAVADPGFQSRRGSRIPIRGLTQIESCSAEWADPTPYKRVKASCFCLRRFRILVGRGMEGCCSSSCLVWQFNQGMATLTSPCVEGLRDMTTKTTPTRFHKTTLPFVARPGVEGCGPSNHWPISSRAQKS